MLHLLCSMPLPVLHHPSVLSASPCSLCNFVLCATHVTLFGRHGWSAHRVCSRLNILNRIGMTWRRLHTWQHRPRAYGLALSPYSPSMTSLHITHWEVCFSISPTSSSGSPTLRFITSEPIVPETCFAFLKHFHLSNISSSLGFFVRLVHIYIRSCLRSGFGWWC